MGIIGKNKTITTRKTIFHGVWEKFLLAATR
jgi:hypothetical protein